MQIRGGKSDFFGVSTLQKGYLWVQGKLKFAKNNFTTCLSPYFRFCTFFAFLVPFVTALFNGCLRPISHAEDGPWNWSETFVVTNYGLAITNNMDLSFNLYS